MAIENHMEYAFAGSIGQLKSPGKSALWGFFGDDVVCVRRLIGKIFGKNDGRLSSEASGVKRRVIEVCVILLETQE